MNFRINLPLKTIVFSCFLLVFSNILFAQDDSVKGNSTFWENVRFGGGLGLSTGSGFFSATLAPSAIYDFNDQVALGVGLNGTYNKRDNFYKSTILGGSIIGLFNPINEIQLSAEFEELNVSRNFTNSTFIDDNYWQPALFLGAGYRTNNITFGLRYDLLFDNNKSVYADAVVPFVRVFF